MAGSIFEKCSRESLVKAAGGANPKEILHISRVCEGYEKIFHLSSFLKSHRIRVDKEILLIRNQLSRIIDKKNDFPDDNWLML